MLNRPEGWEQRVDARGRTYYGILHMIFHLIKSLFCCNCDLKIFIVVVNHKTRTTQWQPPGVSPVAAPAHAGSAAQVCFL